MKHGKKFLMNQLGFSLVQGMIIAGVVAASSLVATRLLTDQKLAQKGAETRDQIDDLHNIIYSVLQSRLDCRETMVVNGLQGLLGASTTAHPLNSISSTDAVLYVANGIYMNNNVRIASILLNAPSVADGTRRLDITYARLNAGAADRTKSGYGAKDIRKSITLRIQKEPATGAFSACYAITDDKANAMNATTSSELGNDLSRDMCFEMNGGGGQTVFTWDEANSICRPSAACPANQIYTGFDSVGAVKCRDIRAWMDFNSIIGPPPASCPPGSTVGLQIVGQTVSITCM
jgi:hypothetical protein